MEGPLKPAAADELSAEPAKARRRKSAHLICAAPFWGIAAAIGCGYFAYAGYSALRNGDYAVTHDGWALLTYAVWILFALGLISEVRCWRERTFFGLVLFNLIIGLLLAAWPSLPVSDVRAAERIEVGIWLLAAVAGLTTTRRVQNVLPQP